MTKKPLVSICCTCKNSEQTIRRHLDSIASVFSRYDNLEFVVQDGNSTDATLSIIQEYSHIFGDKLHLVSEQDSCASEGFWRALSRCRGEIICTSLTDEELLPNTIPLAVAYFMENPDIDVIHGDIYQTDIDGNIQFANPSQKFNLVGYLSHQIPMHFAASIFRKSAFIKAGLLPYPNRYGLITDDFEIWIYLGLTSRIEYYPEVFAKYAVHSDAISVRSDRVVDSMAQRLLFIKKLFSNYSLPDEVKSNKTTILSNFYVFAINLLQRSNLYNETQPYRDALTQLTTGNILLDNTDSQVHMPHTNTPILFLVFNRPEPTEQVFESIRSARPRRLYVAADGPRDAIPSDIMECVRTREIIKRVDWPCEVKTLFRDKNLGCKYAVSSAITWFFEHEEEGIILEDDCLPAPTFFIFCEELLEKYRHDSRIGIISGDNFQFGKVATPDSYYFSRFTHIWGWATWKRVWKSYDVEMTQWPTVRRSGLLNDILDNQTEVNTWTNIFERTYYAEINTWDYQLMLSCWLNGYLNILPCRNLVKNIGFNTQGTHITDFNSPLANMETFSIEFPLLHPQFYIRNTIADLYSNHTVFNIRSSLDILKQIDLTEHHKSYLKNYTPSNKGDEQVNTLFELANKQFNIKHYDSALKYIISAKATKKLQRGLDLLRAQCFINLGQKMGAIEALREELRWFPDNNEAKNLLESLLDNNQGLGAQKTYEIEFSELLKTIRPYTMLSEQRLFSLYQHARYICENDIQGNFVECGVAAGGSSALLAWVIKKYSRHPRRLFSFDSFSGMPQPTDSDKSNGKDAESTGWGTGTCAAPESSVIEICTKVGAVDLVTTVKGYFEETLLTMRNWVGMISFLHMDGDWYASTKAILTNLYERLTNDAIVQVDDYGYWDGCKKAIHEFEAAHSIHFDLQHIDGTGVWFRKPATFPINDLIDLKTIDEFMECDPTRCGIESQMSTNERFQLFWIIKKLLPARTFLSRFIEIGSYSGASLFLTCKAFMHFCVSFQGIAIEPGGTPTFYKILDAMRDHVIHFRMFSTDASKQIKRILGENSKAEFILIDGDHSYEGVYQDIENFYPLLAPGGIMLFHDWLPPLDTNNRDFILQHHAGKEPGIRQACSKLMEQKYKCEHIKLPLLFPSDPTQTQAHLPIIPEVFSTMRAYRKPLIFQEPNHCLKDREHS